jgi:hypothetical protein
VVQARHRGSDDGRRSVAWNLPGLRRAVEDEVTIETDAERTARWERDRDKTPPETREAMIARWERQGFLDPACRGCREVYDSPKRPSEVFGPGHKASDRCRSGKYPHCSCDTCF